MLGSDFRKRLQAGEVLLGCNVRHSRTAEIGAILAACGYSWIMLDSEHSPITPHLGYDIALGAIRAGILPLGRVKENRPSDIGHWMTNGAMGVIVPHVESAAEAEAAAHASRYPPVGGLSVPGSIPQLGYGRPLAESAKAFNEESMTLAMIESRQAVADVENIAAVPGVDVLFIGASDLVHDMGLPGRYDDPQVVDAVRRTVDAARRQGKYVAMGGPGRDDQWTLFIELGVQMVLTENDLSLLMRGARERSAFFAGLAGE